MRWQDREESSNVDDRRKISPAGMAIGGGVGTLLLALVVMFLGGDPRALLQPQAQQRGGAQVNRDPARDEAEEPLRKFSSVVLKDTEDVWNMLFPEQMNKQYHAPKMVLYRDRTGSGCGAADSQVGPFYCPADQSVYLDLSFFEEMQRKFKAPGDFAMAYVIAHEVAHHVQNQLGLSDQVQARQQRARSKEEANELSVRLELQADYLAGVWAHHAQQSKQILEKGDLEEALNAATRIGDDVLQKQATGTVRPESFTHGSASQRVKWLKAGLQSGDMTKMMTLFELEYEQL